MLVLLSPAKSLDFSVSSNTNSTKPRLLEHTELLAAEMRKFDAPTLMKMMDISHDLATLNTARFSAFSAKAKLGGNAKQAILAFDGDVYTGLNAKTFNDEDLAFAQTHLRILSGLYGLLRPMDLMQAYRLEMGTTLKTKRGNNLYQFWGEAITELINKDLKASGSKWLINLASEEYFSAVKPALIKGQILKINFKELRGDTYKVISFSAKKARGTMARLIIENRIQSPAELKAFTPDGYIYAPEMSTETEWNFVK